MADAETSCARAPTAGTAASAAAARMRALRQKRIGSAAAKGDEVIQQPYARGRSGVCLTFNRLTILKPRRLPCNKKMMRGRGNELPRSPALPSLAADFTRLADA